MNAASSENRMPTGRESCACGHEIISLLPELSSTHMTNVMASRLSPEHLERIARQLVEELGYRFASLVARNNGRGARLDYWFYHAAGMPWLVLRVDLAPECRELPSISQQVHAVDWHERSIEDLFGLSFTGHPKLGDFVLHEEWPEGTNPMLPDFDASIRPREREIDPHWEPEKILQTPGAFVMPIGPVYSDFAESAQFFLETVGEDVVRMVTRFHFKYRGIEKHAEGRQISDVLLTAERFSGSSAVAHATAFCRAVEAALNIAVPPRAEAIRLIAAEVERIRHHFGLLSDICHSTGMIVPSAEVDILEEDALRLSARWAGHRYLYGLVTSGGVTRDYSDTELSALKREIDHLIGRAQGLRDHLETTSSFLDRFEGVGTVPLESACQLGLVGPVARASGLQGDLRVYSPYGHYAAINQQTLAPKEALEPEGDGYARIRVLFAELASAADWIKHTVEALPGGPVMAPMSDATGEGLGYVEAPKGAAFHFVELGKGLFVRRWHITSPSFVNWHGFHLAAENFAFQDFPIMMATFGLSIAESDK
ncbi:MAG: NADH-quinone oxidoreductase subunit C [Phycisphaerae bacterium]